MELALKLGLPIIGVNLNNLRKQDLNRCPPYIRDELAAYISFNAAILQYALENWPRWHSQYKQEGETGPYYFKEEIYKRLGL
jgi:hypothetical protein